MKRCCATFISIVFVLLVAPAGRAVEIVAAASGNWSSTTTWAGGVLPGLEDDVKIPTGLTVTLNTNVECGGIVVEGKLEVERANRTLLCDYLIVQTTGAVFEVGTAASRFLQTFTLTLKGLSTEPAPVMGAKVLGAHNGGKLELHGRDRVEWTRLGVNAPQCRALRRGHRGARRSASASATTSVALWRSSSESFSSARWPLASTSERGPAP